MCLDRVYRIGPQEGKGRRIGWKIFTETKVGKLKGPYLWRMFAQGWNFANTRFLLGRARRYCSGFHLFRNRKDAECFAKHRSSFFVVPVSYYSKDVLAIGGWCNVWSRGYLKCIVVKKLFIKKEDYQKAS